MADHDKTREDTRTDLTRRGDGEVAGRSRPTDIDAFLAAAKRSAPGSGTGRLVFAMDATMSRQPTWDRAIARQSEMFAAVETIGTLDVQLVYFRGFRECRASKWVSDPASLRSLMERIDCRGGQTQIGKVLAHALKENAKRRVSAVAYVGDAMEESVDALCARAGELGLHGVKLFMFQEGRDAATERAYREMARLSKGAYARLDGNSADRLAELLAAVAAYAAGGLKALEARGEGGRKLLTQMRP